jgi:hypothetical protein
VFRHHWPNCLKPGQCHLRICGEHPVQL